MQLIDDAAADLQRLIEADFGALPHGTKPFALLLSWLTYKARTIPPRPRSVTVSPEVAAVREIYPAIDKITRMFSSGRSLLPWLSDTVRRNKQDHKADPLFNDWKISHFHLSRVWATPNKIRRTGDLLYAYVSADEAALLIVRPHGQWAERAMLEVLDRVLPEASQQFIPEGVTPDKLSDEQYLNLRKNGYNAIFEVNGHAYRAPGMGRTSSGHSVRTVLYADNFQMHLDYLRSAIPQNKIPQGLSRAVLGNLGLPVRLGVAMIDGGLAICDKNRRLVLHQMKCME